MDPAKSPRNISHGNARGRWRPHLGCAQCSSPRKGSILNWLYSTEPGRGQRGRGTPFAGDSDCPKLLSRRDALRHSLSATALAALCTVAGALPPRAAAEGLQSTEANVKDHGATGDGNTDDTAAIHAARDAAGAEGRILIPPGSYAVAGLVASLPGQTWHMDQGAVIKAKPGSSVALRVSAVDVSVVGGVIDCSNLDEGDSSKNAIEIAADGVSVREVEVLNSPWHGIAAYDCSQITISGCKIKNSSRAGIWAQNGSLPVTSDILLTDNLVDNSSAGNFAEGIGVRGNDKIAHRVSRVTISRNTVRLPHGQPGRDGKLGRTGSISVTDGTDWAVQNNVIVGGFFGITCPDPVRGTISINTVRGFSGIGIEIPGNVDNVTIIGNTIDADGMAASSGIQASAGFVNNLSIVGNEITNFSGASRLLDFSSGSISEKVRISGNYLTAASDADSLTAVYFNGSITDATLTGNIVDGSSSPKSQGVLFLNSVERASISGNNFANLSGAVVRMGARGASYTLDNITIVNNSISNCGARLEDSTADDAFVGPNIYFQP